MCAAALRTMSRNAAGTFGAAPLFATIASSANKADSSGSSDHKTVSGEIFATSKLRAASRHDSKVGFMMTLRMTEKTAVLLRLRNLLNESPHSAQRPIFTRKKRFRPGLIAGVMVKR